MKIDTMKNFDNARIEQAKGGKYSIPILDKLIVITAVLFILTFLAGILISYLG